MVRTGFVSAPHYLVNWVRTGDQKSVDYTTGGGDPMLFRVRVADRKIETITSLKRLHRATGPVGNTEISVAPDGCGIHPRHRHAGDLCPDSEVAVNRCRADGRMRSWPGEACLHWQPLVVSVLTFHWSRGIPLATAPARGFASHHSRHESMLTGCRHSANWEASGGSRATRKKRQGSRYRDLGSVRPGVAVKGLSSVADRRFRDLYFGGLIAAFHREAVNPVLFHWFLAPGSADTIPAAR